MTTRTQRPQNNALSPKFTPEESFIIAWNKLLHIVKIHDNSNKLVRHAAKLFILSIAQLSEAQDAFTIEKARLRFYIQKKKVLNRNETTTVIQQLMGFFDAIDVAGFVFSLPETGDRINQAVLFAQLLNQASKKENPANWLRYSIENAGLDWVQLTAKEQHTSGPHGEATRQKARKVYSYAFNSISNVTQRIASKKRIGIRKSIRVVQNMADLVISEEEVLLGLSTIKDYDNYTYAHSVNVSILSMCLGQKIGLSKKALVRLGICGLFHDLGKVDIDINIINKAGKLSDSEFEKIQQHSLNSVRQILKLQASRKMKSQIVLPPFEHHLKYDLSGYPHTNWSKPLSLFGRIITIADVYDALTSARVYRPVAMSQDRALGIMLEGSGRDFDPLLLKWFINMVGVYPVGTLLKLSDGQMGIVMKSSSDEAPTKPRVALLISDKIEGYIKGEEVELTETHPVSGEPLRVPVESYNPAQFGIKAADFLV